MIVIHIDSQKDTTFLKKCYEGIEDTIVLYNPNVEEVNKALKENTDARVMMLGHGSPSGLFSKDWKGDVISKKNVDLLKGRECIGIWCYAKTFARRYALKGFFTSMFISNEGEAKSFGYKATEEEVFKEVEVFAERVHGLIADGTPLDEWVEILQDSADYDKPFVKYNYDALEYFDGTQEPLPYDYYGHYEDYDDLDSGYGSGYYGSYGKSGKTYAGKWYNSNYSTKKSEDDTAEMESWFDLYCYENGIEGEWARDIAYPIFKAGWDYHKDSILI